jgi:hypothetical protein
MYEEVTEEVAAANEERKPHLLFSSFWNSKAHHLSAILVV